MEHQLIFWASLTANVIVCIALMIIYCNPINPIEKYWDEIRLFTRWCMHSGNCRNSVDKRDYNRFLKERDMWVKRERNQELFRNAE